MRAFILGSTGYTGMMLVRLLLDHPHISSVVPVSTSSFGKPVHSVDPGVHLGMEKLGATQGKYVSLEDVSAGEADVVFSALPHKTSAQVVGPFVGKVPVIDLSADFRFRDPATYEAWYAPHPMPEVLQTAAYGLTEWYRDEIKDADLIACPGCYPTCTLLPLLPLAAELDGPIVVNALSGLSGAGRKERRNLLFNERSENAAAYNPGRSHRHLPELVEKLRLAGSRGDVVFTPHLIPIKQGMLVTTVVHTQSMSREHAVELITAAYRDSPFVVIREEGLPETRDVRLSNRCDIAVQKHESQLLLVSVIDNLVKGAAGQAVQNMNVRFGFHETAGLRTVGEF